MIPYMFEAAIFDLDGVLIETEGIHMEMVQVTFRQIYNFELSNEDLRLIVARHPSDYVPELVALHHLDPQKIPEVMQNYQQIYFKLWQQKAKLISGVTDVIIDLSKLGVKLSIATNGSMQIFEEFSKRFHFGGVFSPVTTGEEVKKKKPDPEIYLIARGKLSNVSTDKILVLEDSEPGVLAAKAAGLKVAAIYNKYTAYQNFDKADYRFKSLAEILELF